MDFVIRLSVMLALGRKFIKSNQLQPHRRIVIFLYKFNTFCYFIIQFYFWICHLLSFCDFYRSSKSFFSICAESSCHFVFWSIKQTFSSSLYFRQCVHVIQVARFFGFEFGWRIHVGARCIFFDRRTWRQESFRKGKISISQINLSLRRKWHAKAVNRCVQPVRQVFLCLYTFERLLTCPV